MKKGRYIMRAERREVTPQDSETYELAQWIFNPSHRMNTVDLLPLHYKRSPKCRGYIQVRYYMPHVILTRPDCRDSEAHVRAQQALRAQARDHAAPRNDHALQVYINRPRTGMDYDRREGHDWCAVMSL